MHENPPEPAAAPGAAAARPTFEALFRRHYAPLCEFVRGYVHSEDAAEDIVQDLFLALWEKHDLPDAPTFTPAYLYRAARNRALKHLRHRRVVSRWEERAARAPAPVHDGTDHDVRRREARESAERAIAALPDRCREIFLLSRRQQMSYAEIAETLGLSVKTVAWASTWHSSSTRLPGTSPARRGHPRTHGLPVHVQRSHHATGSRRMTRPASGLAVSR